MIEKTFNMGIAAGGSDDGTLTYEIRRVVAGGGKKALLIESH